MATAKRFLEIQIRLGRVIRRLPDGDPGGRFSVSHRGWHFIFSISAFQRFSFLKRLRPVARLLPVPYYMVTPTVPEQLRWIFLASHRLGQREVPFLPEASDRFPSRGFGLGDWGNFGGLFDYGESSRGGWPRQAERVQNVAKG